MDLSLLKNIDFTNRDNILFLVIVLIIFVVAVSIFIIIFTKIMKMLKKIIDKFFSKYIKKSKQKKPENLLQSTEEKKEEPSPKNVAMGNVSNLPNGNKENSEDSKNDSSKKDESAGLSKPKSVQESGGKISFKIGENKTDSKSKTQETYKQKEDKSIAEHLGKLKANPDENKDTLASKMPSRTEVPEDVARFEKIKIPQRMVLSVDKEVREDGLVGGTGKRDVFGEIPNKKPLADKKEPDNKEVFKKGLKQITSKSSNKSISSDKSIFEGKPEVSRIKLAYKVRMDPKVWQAGRAVGLQLSPVERSNLVKEVFSPKLGTSISKKDLQTSLRQLNRKMLNTTNDPKTHEKIRKEIKFFKKIGGVK